MAPFYKAVDPPGDTRGPLGVADLLEEVHIVVGGLLVYGDPIADWLAWAVPQVLSERLPEMSVTKKRRSFILWHPFIRLLTRPGILEARVHGPLGVAELLEEVHIDVGGLLVYGDPVADWLAWAVPQVLSERLTGMFVTKKQRSIIL